jgi:hypothetical protein
LSETERRGALGMGPESRSCQMASQSTLRIPVDGVLVLEEGDIMFLVVMVMMKPEIAGESQVAGGVKN